MNETDCEYNVYDVIVNLFRIAVKDSAYFIDDHREINNYFYEAKANPKFSKFLTGLEFEKRLNYHTSSELDDIIRTLQYVGIIDAPRYGNYYNRINFKSDIGIAEKFGALLELDASVDDFNQLAKDFVKNLDRRRKSEESN